MMRRHLPLALSALLFAACVTINVYFPAAAAEKAADQIIDTVTGSTRAPAGSATPSTLPPGAAPTAAPQGTTPPAAPPGSSNPARPPTGRSGEPHGAALLVAALGRALELLVPAAQAQANANLDVETPEIRAITGSMRARFAQLEKYFDAGVVGLTANGLIDVRDAASVPLAERALVKSLVAEDNRDRETLYAEIARANAHPEWENSIRQTFARRWVERGAKAGWYYQDAGGAWKQK